MLSVNTNLSALNVSRNLNRHYSELAISTQRLSTGLRINSSADDAAGLAIRELQRADISALHQGARNANDAISLIQTADGALSVIDEKLIRMKELAEQAATGTYNSTQRMMIDSEFQQMASEIDRIANATDFNGIHLLDGTLGGAHDGSGLTSTGAMKIHFGSGNDSAEDYYYIEIGDCTTKGLGLREEKKITTASTIATSSSTNELSIVAYANLNSPVDISNIELNNYDGTSTQLFWNNTLESIENVFPQQGTWYICGDSSTNNFAFKIPAGSTNVVINIFGFDKIEGYGYWTGDNDIQLFTTNGVHLTGTPMTDIVWSTTTGSLEWNKDLLGFDSSQYDDTYLNTGPYYYDSNNPYSNFKYTTYNGMIIGYTGDIDYLSEFTGTDYRDTNDDYETITINYVTEDLIVFLNGLAAAVVQVYYDPPSQNPPDPGVDPTPDPDPNPGTDPQPDPDPTPDIDDTVDGDIIHIDTQDKAQQALVKINDAIVKKDKIRAHLGALQNRFENTITNLNIQAENLQNAESRISDVDVATEMTEFIRNQILTQSAVAMLSQANSLPQMTMQLIGG